MSKYLLSLALLAALGLSAQPALAKATPAKTPAPAAAPAQNAPKPEVETIESWSYVCQTNAEKKKECVVLQEMQGKDEGGKAGRLARVMFVRKPDGKGLVIDTLLPLGINLQAGAALAIDDKPQKMMKLLRCTAAGCEAAMEPEESFLQEMKKGTTLKVGFNAGPKTLVVPVPLKGLDKALDKLGK